MSVSRRKFVKTAATTTAVLSFPMIIPRHVLGGANFVAPSEKVNVGIVGCGGQGQHNMRQLLQLDDVQVTAIADPAEYWNLNSFYYRDIAGRGPVKDEIEEHYQKKTPNFKVGEYVDFREMLEKETSLDAILCATPDHTHAFVASNAMRAGKHVYVEKPMAHNLWENCKLAEIAKETGVATQMGNMGHSSEGIRQVVELLKAGAIGDVTQAHSWCHATRWTNGLHDMPLGSTIPQPNFDWDLWLGPRESIPYHEDYTPVKWRDFWRFGCGAIGDFACHDMDATVWAYDLKIPETVQIYPIGQSNEEIAPHGELGYFDFKANGKQKDMKITWYAGSGRPAHHESFPDNFELSKRGLLFEGSKGTIQCDGAGGSPRIFPQELRGSIDKPKKSIRRVSGHHSDWIEAIKGGPASSANFEYSARLTEIALLGVLSVRMGGAKIKWDAKNMKAIGLPDADRFIKEPVRKGWEVV
ncbi:MAG: Gfo/Idh/MocA family oxidoreductase [Verrucomicrobia bacterium]|nr:Gfo/Idh/MocA family oxidoreductase [Verrucomicrobiota bacterium]MDA1068645.1 Gfo/Idh/MocA family oxidoreductase [Verrucomicrobiota bacterium]